MSGPIVRRYGFPNFDAIFGKKEVPHGVDEPETPSQQTTPPSAEKPAPGEVPKGTRDQKKGS